SQLENVPEFAQAIGEEGYAANTTVAFNGAVAKYVKITANSNWGGGGFFNQYGLSEVRFTAIPVSVKEPNPEIGATDVAVDAILGWRAGREVASHDVYVGTDADALTLAGTVTEPAFDTASIDLELGQTYHWRVDEVNDAEIPTTWQGDPWSFTTQEYIVVDDFESYNDIDPPDPESHTIFGTWSDGYLTPATNGALVGYEPAQPPSDPSYMEQTIVYDGSQSLPFSYNNTTAGNSEITVNVADLQVVRDWSKYGVKFLALWLKGDLGHAATDRLYVKINGTRAEYDGDLTTPLWKPFSVDLASLDMDLSNITTLSIGVDGGGSGMLLLDGIRLYQTAPIVAGPPPGGDPSLVGHWKLDETSGLTAAESSGYGNHGTLKTWDRTLMDMAATGWTAGIKDGALFLENGQYVDFGNDKSLQLTGQVTVSAWVKMQPANDGVYMGIGGKIVSSPYNGYELVRHSSNVFRMWMGNDGGDLSSVDSDATYTDTDWHHVVGVISNNTGYLYVDGVKQTEETACGLVDTGDFAYIGRHYSNGNDDRYWTGTIDDFRIYYRALSAAEISGL
ncbi:MAG: LamG domain-containing protein, partial [Planctomycetota bacterium]